MVLEKICILGNFVLDRIYRENKFIIERLGGGIYYSALPFIEYSIQDIILYTTMNPLIYPYIYKTIFAKIIIIDKWVKQPNIFKLIYASNRRDIIVEESSEEITLRRKLSCRYTILNPVLAEIPYQAVRTLKNNSIITVADIQGFARSITSDGRITYREFNEFSYMLGQIDILHVSIDELRDIVGINDNKRVSDVISAISSKYDKTLIVVTRGVKPPLLVKKGKIIELDDKYTCRWKVWDTTGAGDYFLGKLLLYFMDSYDESESAIKAHIDTCRWIYSRSNGRRKPHRGTPPIKPPPPTHTPAEPSNQRAPKTRGAG